MAEIFLSLQHLKERNIFFSFLAFSRKIFSAFLMDGLIIKWFLVFFPIEGWVSIFLFSFTLFISSEAFLFCPSSACIFFPTSSIFCFSPRVIWALSVLSPCLFLTKSDKRKRLLTKQTAGRNLCLHFKVFGKCSLCLVLLSVTQESKITMRASLCYQITHK